MGGRGVQIFKKFSVLFDILCNDGIWAMPKYTDQLLEWGFPYGVLTNSGFVTKFTVKIRVGFSLMGDKGMLVWSPFYDVFSSQNDGLFGPLEFCI